MKKKIKLTESQVEMLKNWEETSSKKKVLKITSEQYMRIFGNLDENSKLTGHPIMGDGGSEYKPQSEGENKKTTQSFNESISEEISNAISFNDFLPHLQQHIKNIVSNPTNHIMDSFWDKLNISWGDIARELIDMGVAKVELIGRGKTIKLLKPQFPEAVKSGLSRKLYDKLVSQTTEGISLGDDMELTEFDYDAFKTQSPYDGDEAKFKSSKTESANLVYFRGSDNPYPFALFDIKGQLSVYFLDSGVPNEVKKYGSDVDLESFGMGELHVPEEEVISEWVNYMLENGYIKPHVVDNEGNGQLVLNVVNDIIKDDLLNITQNDDKLVAILNSVGESTTTGSVGGSYVTPKAWAKDKSNMVHGKKPMFNDGTIVEAPEKVERYAAMFDMYIYGKDENDAKQQINLIVRSLDKKFPESRARVQELRKATLGKIGETLERKGQVEFDDCTKLDNNKTAQNGGCSVGAVDNVVDVKESLIERVAKQTNRTTAEVKAIIEANFNKK